MTHLEEDADLTPASLEDLMPSGMCIAMVNTTVAGMTTSRPVAVAETSGLRLSFLVARNSDWVSSIAGGESLVHLTVANDANSLYLSLNGTAIVVHDSAEASRIWSKPAGIWFEGPSDPKLAVLHFDVSDGHYWDGPRGLIGRTFALARCLLSGNDDHLGSDGRLNLDPAMRARPPE